MRKIDKIIVHHSSTARNLDLNKAINSFSNNHKTRLHQPQSKTGLYVAYHYVIAENGGFKQTRLDDEIGYHASNWPASESSIGICLIGNFDKEQPTPQQLFALRDIIKTIKAKYVIRSVRGHRNYSSKSCPGLNLTDKMIETAFHPK